jgi:uncharacterized phiE125 gp8 family phage protein
VGLVRVTAPDKALLTPQEAAAQVRSTEPKELDWLADRVDAATETAELAIDRRFVTQKWKLLRDAFPGARGETGREARALFVPYPPLVQVHSIKYIDEEGVEQTLDAAKYRTCTTRTPGEIVPAFGESWPTTRCIEDAVAVEFTCGYGPPAQVPPLLRAAVALILGTLYANRENVAPVEMKEIPQTARWLLEKYSWKRWRS